MRHRFSLLIIGLVILMLGAACNAPAQPPGVVSDKPVSGGTLNIPTTDPNDFDMSSQGSTTTNARILKPGYSTVLRLKTGPGTGYSDIIVEPFLADRWETSPDAKTYTFHLRKGVKFANVAPVNGRELTSADVKWSYEYMARAGEFSKLTPSQFGYLFEGLDSITTPDPYTVVVKFTDSFAPFLTYAASSDNVIMPKEVYARDGHFKDMILGTGPFQPDFASSQKGSSWLIKKNPAYWEEGKPYLDAIKFIVIADQATEQAAFAAKQIDFHVGSRDPQTWEDIKRNAPGAVQFDYTSTPTIFALNFERKPLDNLKIRKAFSMALDRDEHIKSTGGKGEWALAYSNIFDKMFTQEEIKSFIKYDPTGAKALVTEAGFANGISMELLYGNTDSTTQKTAELIQSQMKKANINLTLKPLGSVEFTTARRAKNGDIFLLSEAQRADLDGAMNLSVRTGGSFNYNNLADKKVDDLLSGQRKETDPAKRNILLRDLLRYINENALILSTWRTASAFFWQPYVKDFYHHADLRDVGVLQNVWLAK